MLGPRSPARDARVRRRTDVRPTPLSSAEAVLTTRSSVVSEVTRDIRSPGGIRSPSTSRSRSRPTRERRAARTTDSAVRSTRPGHTADRGRRPTGAANSGNRRFHARQVAGTDRKFIDLASSREQP